MEPLLVLLGAGAGALTTVTGMGGGLLLVLALGALCDPATALAVTAPALLAGNAHRLWLLRTHLDRRVAGVFALGAFPGALLASLVAVAVPERALAWVLVAVSALAIATERGWIALRPPRPALAPVGFGVGALAAAGGAGPLVSPVLLSAGLRGEAFVATSSAGAVAIHLGRIAGYGAGGRIDAGTLAWSALLAVGLAAGNLAGRRIAARLDEKLTERATYAVLALLAVLALAGVA